MMHLCPMTNDIKLWPFRLTYTQHTNSYNLDQELQNTARPPGAALDNIVVFTGMFPTGDTSSGTLIAVCLSVCVCVCPPTYRYIAPRMIQRIILILCGYVGCDDGTNVSNFGYEPIKFSSLKLIK